MQIESLLKAADHCHIICSDCSDNRKPEKERHWQN